MYTIRLFRAGDQSAVRALVLSGLGDHFGVIDETMNPDLDDIFATYVMAGDYAVVVEIGDVLIGAGTLVRDESGAGRLVRMSVARDARGKGVGRALVEHLLAEANRRGMRKVLVETNDDWEDAIGLYRACGFQVDGLRDGDIHMSLELPVGPPFQIRPETPADAGGVRAVNEQAFCGTAEADLVEALWREGSVIVSLVAAVGGQVAGHILFSRLSIERATREVQAAALAPLAVIPARQRLGIGSALVLAGIEACQAAGCAAILVLGDPAYYGRFGFALETARGLQSHYAGSHYGGLELVPESLRGGGEVRYPDAFRLVE
jgi:putative acetyltransferase